ncbi:MAG: hypothetical protein JSV08_04645 [Acidobacteriota bacterium]|nr:MAG: hypothetical protein JSV08_04645 [Acidobacteriota bacterium]
MSVVLDPAGVIDTDTNTADILVLLSPVPYGGVPGDLFYVFSASLDCSTGVFSGTDDVLCASIDGTINSAGGSSGTLTLEDCSSKALCTSGWNDNPLGDEVCDWDTECFLCEPLGTPLGTSDDASASPQLRESPVLQRLRMGR